MAVIRSTLVGVFVLAYCLSTIDAFFSFQSRIPNGDAVPNTCSTVAGDVWPGVGHENINGAGTRNVFGLAFLAAGRTWTVELCNQDSDGDGISNGAELGDPACTWTTGASPPEEALSHPAICEPVTSDDCKIRNVWVFSCPAADVATPTTAPTTVPTTAPTTVPTTTPTTVPTTVPTTTPTTVPTTTPTTAPTTAPTAPPGQKSSTAAEQSQSRSALTSTAARAWCINC